MIKIVVVMVGALIATVPSVLLARIYLKRRNIPVGPEGTVKTFMEVAPAPLKGLLITLNFCLFGAMIGGLWVALG